MTQATLDGVFSHAFLDDISNFWFRHLEAEHVIIPSIEDAAPWFSQSDAYDWECFGKFGAQLELIQTMQPSVADILTAAKPSSSLHWISLIILLDQIPRNCFRGAKALVVFTLFDKLAFEVASQALELDLPKEKRVRFRLAYGFWFYMPMEHSENLEVHKKLKEAHSEMWHDHEMLLEKAVKGWDGPFAQHHAVLLKRRDSFKKFRETMEGICEDKKSLLRRFGRFPQRNSALGRPSTVEEIEWLKIR
ncbi:hypothetical protein AA0114_g2302 [Alternaria tenuissima]|uniref:DUF924-domain-containing protein n=1 Tax=Alternaria tenuissima TaxID=119927 RepID=A0A4Q4MRG3_9PLEO|nr:hypothetical protein AA0114_g2302 [Alternaria tenuissima]